MVGIRRGGELTAGLEDPKICWGCRPFELGGRNPKPCSRGEGVVAAVWEKAAGRGGKSSDIWLGQPSESPEVHRP